MLLRNEKGEKTMERIEDYGITVIVGLSMSFFIIGILNLIIESK